MFSRKSCYFFVRPKRKYLEVCVFLGRKVRAPQVKRAEQGSKAKYYHILHVTHRDEVETPITDWLREAYDLQDVLAAKATKPPAPKKARKAVKKAVAKKAVAKKTGTTRATRR
jgi:hypothetical protein